MNVETGGAQVRGLKAALEAQVPALAASLDGLTFTYISPVTAPQAAGGYVTVETPDGPRLGQIRQAVVEQAEGPEIGAAVGGFDNVRMRIRFDRLTGTGTMLEPSPSFHDAAFAAAPAEAIGRWQESSRGRGAMLRLGEAAMAPGVLAELDAAGFGRHSFLCGQSGSGKSYCARRDPRAAPARDRHSASSCSTRTPTSTGCRSSRDGADPALAERWRDDRAAASRVRGADREGDDRLRLRFCELEPARSRPSCCGSTRCADREEYDALGALLDARGRRGSRGADHRDAARRGRRPGVQGARAADPQPRRRRVVDLVRDSGESGRSPSSTTTTRAASWSTSARSRSREEQSLVAAAVLATLWRRRAERAAGAARDRRGAQRLPAPIPTTR